MFSKYNMNIDTKSTFRFIESVAEVFVYSIIYMLVYKYLFAENTFPDFITASSFRNLFFTYLDSYKKFRRL